MYTCICCVAKVIPISPPFEIWRIFLGTSVSLRRCMDMPLSMWKEAARLRARSMTLCCGEWVRCCDFGFEYYVECFFWCQLLGSSIAFNSCGCAEKKTRWLFGVTILVNQREKWCDVDISYSCFDISGGVETSFVYFVGKRGPWLHVQPTIDASSSSSSST